MQIKIIGTLVFLAISIKALIPPLSSVPVIPSISSIIIIFFELVLLSIEDKVVLFIKKPTELLIVSLFLLSLAFNSKVLYPLVLAKTLIVEVFPIPGGPLIIAALAFTFSYFLKVLVIFDCSFLCPCKMQSSQESSHNSRFLICC